MSAGEIVAISALFLAILLPMVAAICSEISQARAERPTKGERIRSAPDLREAYKIDDRHTLEPLSHER